jgi:hypothetical protein
MDSLNIIKLSTSLAPAVAQHRAGANAAMHTSARQTGPFREAVDHSGGVRAGEVR